MVHTTFCSFSWPGHATGWRSHTWQPSDCTNGLPRAGSISMGFGANGSGTGGQVGCEPTKGRHYNHPTVAGKTNGEVKCLFVNPDAFSDEDPTRATLCSASWGAHAVGWRSHQWHAGNCTHGLPRASAKAIGQGINGSGTAGQVMCEASKGRHYNHPTVAGATNSEVKCLFVER